MPPADGPPVRAPRAFALPELLAILAVAAVLLAALAVAGEGARRTARLGDDLAKLRFIGAATGSYAADNADHVWSLSWQGNTTYDTPYGDLNTAPTDNEAAANQAVYLLRTRAGREDIPVIPSWVPYISYNHLVLVEYLDTALPDRTFISSGDKNRQAWADDPAGFDEGRFGANQPEPTAFNRRWPYSSSFTVPPAFWDRSAVGSRITQQTQNTYVTPTTADLGPTFLADTAFPSQKVFLHDQYAWHFGQRAVYATHDEARLPLLFVDGSARVEAAAHSNTGWRPNQPQIYHSFTQFYYSPNTWEPPIPVGAIPFLRGHFRWTRGGVLGRDFGGHEIDTSR